MRFRTPSKTPSPKSRQANAQTISGTPVIVHLNAEGSNIEMILNIALSPLVRG